MPFVQPQSMPIPFVGGLDEKTDPKQVLAGNLLELSNGQFNKKGQISKRYGYDLLGNNTETGGTITQGEALSTFKDELLLFDGTNAYSYIENTGSWLSKGTAISVIGGGQQIIRRNDAQQLNPDVAYLNGVEVYAWEDSRGGVRYSAVDTETKAICASDQIVNSGSYYKPKCVAFNGLIYIFYADTSGALLMRSINPYNPTVIGTSVSVKNDGYASFSYDVAVIGSRMYVAYLTSTPSVDYFYFDTNLTRSSNVTLATGADAFNVGYPSVMNIVGDSGNQIWTAWSDGYSLRAACNTYTDLPLLVNTVVDGYVPTRTITSIECDTNQLQITYELYAASASNHYINSKKITTTGTITSVGTLRSVGLASKAFSYNGNLYCNVTHESTLQSTYFTVLLNQAPFTIVAKTNAQVGGGLRTNNALSEVATVDTGLVKYASLVKGKVLSEANQIFYVLGVSSSSLNFVSANKFLTATQSNNLMLVGGVLQSYDGVSFTEHLFHLYPEGASAVAAGADGFLSTGTYQYLITYEWSDNYGQVQRSSTSTALSVSVTANNHVTLTIPTLRLTAKQSPRAPVSIVIYRTQVNGTTFNQVTSNLAPLQNDPTVDTVTFVDTLSDNSILSNALVYTTGNVLNNVAPPSSSLIATFQNRVFVSGLEDPNAIWFSQNKADDSSFNTIPVEFAPELVIYCDNTGGPITALGVINNNLIIFKETSIYTITGDGPNATGLGEVYANPQSIASDVGCATPNSVKLTPNGLLFKSNKGIYQLDQGLNLSYIGAPVANANAEEITSATLIPDDNQVVFTIASTGQALVFDYFFNQWSHWTGHYAEDSGIWKNSFVWIRSNGRVYQQNRDSFTDAGQPIRLSWTSPNFQFAQLNGWQQVFRCFLLGEYKGPHSLTFEVAYDFNPAYADSITIDASRSVSVWGDDSVWGDASSGAWGGTPFVPYQFRVDFKRQRCTAIRIRVTDAQTSDYNEGYAISAMTFDVGLLPSGPQLPSTATYGTQ